MYLYEIIHVGLAEWEIQSEYFSAILIKSRVNQKHSFKTVFFSSFFHLTEDFFPRRYSSLVRSTRTQSMWPVIESTLEFQIEKVRTSTLYISTKRWIWTAVIFMMKLN